MLWGTTCGQCIVEEGLRGGLDFVKVESLLAAVRTCHSVWVLAVATLPTSRRRLWRTVVEVRLQASLTLARFVVWHANRNAMHQREGARAPTIATL